ncbi:MAG: helix-turn-helix transcriptional regulator [Actinobacteria bacterium]|nr:MAG: helix-turn-helix transcriptional regulator [Actinomycetota bacterium]
MSIPLAECCPSLRTVLDEEQAETLATRFRALADPARLRLLSLLISAGGEACACSLVEPVGRSQPTVSHHLRVLHEANLVERERRGSWVWYWVVPERLEELREALAAAGGERPRGGYPAEQRAVGQAPRRRRRQEREAELVRQT